MRSAAVAGIFRQWEMAPERGLRVRQVVGNGASRPMDASFRLSKGAGAGSSKGVADGARRGRGDGDSQAVGDGSATRQGVALLGANEI